MFELVFKKYEWYCYISEKQMPPDASLSLSLSLSLSQIYKNIHYSGQVTPCLWKTYT